MPVQARHQHVQPRSERVRARPERVRARSERVRARSERVQARPHYAPARSRIWIGVRKPWRFRCIHSILRCEIVLDPGEDRSLLHPLPQGPTCDKPRRSPPGLPVRYRVRNELYLDPGRRRRGSLCRRQPAGSPIPEGRERYQPCRGVDTTRPARAPPVPEPAWASNPNCPYNPYVSLPNSFPQLLSCVS